MLARAMGKGIGRLSGPASPPGRAARETGMDPCRCGFRNAHGRVRALVHFFWAVDLDHVRLGTEELANEAGR